jgi:hypothetical protein
MEGLMLRYVANNAMVIVGASLMGPFLGIVTWLAVQ